MSLPRYLPNVDLPRMGGLDDIGLWHDTNGRFQRRGVSTAKAAAVRAVPGRATAEAAKARPDGVEARVHPGTGVSGLTPGPHRVRWHDDEHGLVEAPDGRKTLVKWDRFEDAMPVVNEMAEAPGRTYDDMESEREAIYVDIAKLQALDKEHGRTPERDAEEDALFAKGRRLRARWDTTTASAISTGAITREEVDAGSGKTWSIADGLASDLGGPSRDGWQPLPDRLYHVTTARDAVLADGRLRTRSELALERGTGLGGGTDDAISFATTPEIAAAIRDGILEAIDVTSGKTTVADLIERARTGDAGSEPFLRDFIRFWARDWNDGDPLPRGVELALPGGENDDPEHRFDVLKIWLAWREQHGGPLDPLFFSVSAEGMAKTDPNQIAVLRARPAGEKALGVPLNGLLGEWRVPTGDAVVLDGEIIDGGFTVPIVNEIAEAPPAPTAASYGFVDDTTVPWADRVSLLAHERAALAADLGDPEHWFRHPSPDTLARLWNGDLTPPETESLDRLRKVEQFGDTVARLVAERAVTEYGGGEPRLFSEATGNEIADLMVGAVAALDPGYDKLPEHDRRFKKPPGVWQGNPEAVAAWDMALAKVRAGQAHLLVKPKTVVVTFDNDDGRLVRVAIEKDDSDGDHGILREKYLTASGKTRYRMDTAGHIEVRISTGRRFGEPQAWVRGAGNFTETRAAIKKAFDKAKKDSAADFLDPPTMRAWRDAMEAMGIDMGTDPGVLVEATTFDAIRSSKGEFGVTTPLGDVKPASLLGKTTAAGFAPYPRAWTSALPPQRFDVSNDVASRTGSAFNARLNDDSHLLRVPSVAANPQHASAVAHEVGHSFQKVIPGLHLGEMWHMIRRLGDHPGEQSGTVSGGRGMGFSDHFTDDYSGRVYPGPNPNVPDDKRGGYITVNGVDPYKQADGEALPNVRAFEIFTTGVQTLYSAKPGRRRLGDDPELTAFTAGMLALTTPATPDAMPVVVNELVERPATVRFDGMHPLPDGETTAHGVRFPPAWTDVHVSDNPTGVGGMIARGVDSKGRQQYLYSAEHTERQAAAKFARVQAFAAYLPGLDATLTGDVPLDDTAAALALIRRTGMRPGGTSDTKADKQAFGATTLLGSHVTLLGGDTARFQFTGKKGVDIDITVDDPLVAAALRARTDKLGTDEPLFDTTAARVNAYLDEHTAPEFKVKDLRTVRANAVAAAMVAQRGEPPASDRERKRWINEVADAVAAQLGNTRTVALASYINPVVFAPWAVGETADDLAIGEVFSVAGVKIRKTVDGYVDDATGMPVNADGTPR